MVSKRKKFLLVSSIISALMIVSVPVSASPITNDTQSDSEITTQACNPCRVKAGYLYPKSQYKKSDFTSLHYITVGGVEYFFWYIDDDKSTATHWYTVWKEE